MGVSKLSIYGEEIQHLHSSGANNTEIARYLKDDYKLDASVESLRKCVARYMSAVNSNEEGLLQECEENGLPIERVKSYWFKNKKYSIQVEGAKDSDSLIDKVKSIVSAYNPDKLRTIEKTKDTNEKAIKATLADMHVGLNPNPNGTSLFQYVYNEKVFNSNLDKVFNSLIKEHNTHGKFDLLLIDDLGDGLDGYDGLTTRGGHKLDQNMTNEEAFSVFVNGKLTLIENCIRAGIANEIIVRNVANDNHSGSFAAIANMTINMILARTYNKDSVSSYTLNRFMEHFKYGNHTFILTHGKDSKFMFKGLPKDLNDKAIRFINDYIDHYDIDSKYIHLEKGDLHQVGYQRTKRFDYRNFMSFAPPSAWVAHNFGDTYSGYSIQIVPKWSNEISHCDYYFEMEKSS